MDVTMDDVLRLVAIQLGRRNVAPEDRILEDLGAESVDVVNLVASAEDRYQITIAETELPDLRTVADLYELVRRRRAETG
jgi:acyl carrier protein